MAAIATSALKLAFLGAALAVYWRPLDVANAVGLPASDSGVQELQAHVVRFMLTAVSYSYALSCSSAWFYTIMALILVQTLCWASFLADGSRLEGFVDAQTEKDAFQLGAVAAFGLLLFVVLFGGRTNSNDHYRRRLIAFYKNHNPEKIPDVGKILKKYEGKEELLFARVHRKYSVLSHTAVEAAVDEFDGDGDDEMDINDQEYIEEVEYIQEMPAGDHGEGEGSEEDEALELIRPRVKSPVGKKAPSVPASPATTTPPRVKSPVVKPPSVPASPSSVPTTTTPTMTNARTPSPSTMVRSAIEDARRAQDERVQQRVAQLTKKKH